MKFTSTLIKGKLIKRYKRFFVDIKVNNLTVTAHCPNTGSMMGLLEKGNNVWLTKNDNPQRKLKFTLEMIEVNNVIIGVNKYSSEEEEGIAIQEINKKSIDEQLKRLSEFKNNRNQEDVSKALSSLREVSLSENNIMPFIIDAVRANVTLGEISDILRGVFGEY